MIGVLLLSILPTDQIQETLKHLSDLSTGTRMIAALSKEIDSGMRGSERLDQDILVRLISMLRGSLIFISGHLTNDYLTPSGLQTRLRDTEAEIWDVEFRFMYQRGLSLPEVVELITNLRAVIVQELRSNGLLEVGSIQFYSVLFDWILKQSVLTWEQLESLNGRLLNKQTIDHLRPIVESVRSPVDLHPVLQIIVDNVRNSGIWPMCAIGMTDAEDREIIVPAQAGFLENYPRDIKFPATGSATLEALRRMQAIAINDVLDDTEFPVLQEAAKAGGYRSILLVPFKVEDIKAVVTFGSSEAHTFTQEEMLLANAISQQVMIAIENAYRYEHEKQRVESLESLNRMIGEQNRLLQRMAETHTTLTRLVLDNAGIEGIINEIRMLLGNPVGIENEHFQLLGYSRDWELFDLHRRASIEAGGTAPELFTYPETARMLADLRKNRRALMIPILPMLGIEKRRIVSPIIAGGDILGYVWAMESLRTFDEQDLITAEQAAMVIALEMVKQRAAYETELRLKTDFIDDLLSKRTTNEAELLQRASYLGFNLNKLSMLFLVECRTAEVQTDKIKTDQSLYRQIVFLTQQRVNRYSDENIVTLLSDRVLVIVPLSKSTPNPDEAGYLLAEDLHQELKNINPSMKVLISLGGVSKDIGELRDTYVQAQRAIDAAKNLGRLDDIVRLPDLGIYGLLYRKDDQGELKKFTKDNLQSLIDYDRQNGTELLKTLGSYLTHQGRLTPTAAELYIHVNTLRQRIERIEDVLGIQINDPWVRLNLQLALKMFEVMTNSEVIRK